MLVLFQMCIIASLYIIFVVSAIIFAVVVANYILKILTIPLLQPKSTSIARLICTRVQDCFSCCCCYSTLVSNSLLNRPPFDFFR